MPFRLLSVLFIPTLFLFAQTRPPLTPDQQAIERKLRTFREMPDQQRAIATREQALKIRELPASAGKLELASQLADLANEGDFGKDTLQEVTNTLAAVLKEQMPRESFAYTQLAQLAHYERMNVKLESEPYSAALKELEANDRKRASTDFSLKDLTGREWKLSDLHGKVVLVNFWATWCPPCRKELPDLDALYAKFKDRGLVVLAISDEEQSKVEPFLKQHDFKFPFLLDPGRVVSKIFAPREVPKSYVFDRDGKLVATAIDVRTRDQFLAMLAKAGLG